MLQIWTEISGILVSLIMSIFALYYSRKAIIKSSFTNDPIETLHIKSDHNLKKFVKSLERRGYRYKILDEQNVQVFYTKPLTGVEGVQDTSVVKHCNPYKGDKKWIEKQLTN